MSRMRLPPLPTIKDLLKIYNVSALKKLSQNFLLDQRITDKIVHSSGKIQNGFVCEVGPGPGGITRSILRKDINKLIVIEKDRRFTPILDHLAEGSDNKLSIYYDDILKVNFDQMVPQEFKKEWEDTIPNIHLIGNLPFNIATPLIIKWLKSISQRSNIWTNGRVRMTLTFQKEVAERIVAPPRSSQRCRLSVMCQNWCDVRHTFTIPGKAFLPKPKVDVGVVHFIPWKSPIIPYDFEMIEKVVRTIFGFRQKFSIRGAENLFPSKICKSLALEMYQLAELKTTIRPFQLTNEEVGRLCKAYKTICDKNPKYYKYNYRKEKTLQDEDEDEEDEDEEENELFNQLLKSINK